VKIGSVPDLCGDLTREGGGGGGGGDADDSEEEDSFDSSGPPVAGKLARTGGLMRSGGLSAAMSVPDLTMLHMHHGGNLGD